MKKEWIAAFLYFVRIINFRKKTMHFLFYHGLLYVQEVVTQPKILNRTTLYNLVHVT